MFPYNIYYVSSRLAEKVRGCCTWDNRQAINTPTRFLFQNVAAQSKILLLKFCTKDIAEFIDITEVQSCFLRTPSRGNVIKMSFLATQQKDESRF